MSHRSKIIKEWLDIKVITAGNTFKEHFEVDKSAVRILGIAISCNYDEQMYYRGSQRIAINEKEYYPEGYESKMLMHGLNVPVPQRIIPLGEDVVPGNRKVEMSYTDTNHSQATFSPYRVRLYVFSTVEETQP